MVRLEGEALVEEVQEQVVVEAAEVQELEEVAALGLVVAALELVVAVLGLEEEEEEEQEQEQEQEQGPVLVQAVVLWWACP